MTKTTKFKIKTREGRVEILLTGPRMSWRETKAQAFELAAKCMRATVGTNGLPVYHGSLYVESVSDESARVVFETMGGHDDEVAEKIAQCEIAAIRRHLQYV